MKKREFSKVGGDVARWRTLDRRVQALRNRMRDVPTRELQAAVDEAVREVRKARGCRSR